MSITVCCNYTSRWHIWTTFLHRFDPRLSIFRFISCIFVTITVFRFCFSLLAAFSAFPFSVIFLLCPFCQSLNLLFAILLIFPPFSFSFLNLSDFLLIVLSSPKKAYFFRVLFPVVGAKGNADPIVVSDDELVSLHTSYVIEIAGSTINVQLVELNYYHYEEVWMGVDQIADPTSPLRDIQISYVRNLGVLVPGLVFDYHNGIITVTLSAEFNPPDSSLQDAIAE